jgi:hypothetical protein
VIRCKTSGSPDAEVMSRVTIAVLAALVLVTTPVCAFDLTAISIKTEATPHGGAVDAIVIVTNGGASKIEALTIACTIIDDKHRPLDIKDGYLTDIGPGATAYTKIQFFVPGTATLRGVGCRPIEMRPLIAGVLPPARAADARG